MKINLVMNKIWIFAPNINFLFDHFWRGNSKFIPFKMNFHAGIVDFGAKIKIG